MRRLAVLAACCGLAGCAAVPSVDPLPDLPALASHPGEASVSSSADVTVLRHPTAPMAPRRAPDYLLAVDSRAGNLSAAVERHLQAITQAAKADSRLLIVIEGYVPDGASPALGLGIADRVLQKVKGRLQEMGVAARRIVLHSKGELHEVSQNEFATPWLEVFLTQP